MIDFFNKAQKRGIPRLIACFICLACFLVLFARCSKPNIDKIPEAVKKEESKSDQQKKVLDRGPANVAVRFRYNIYNIITDKFHEGMMIRQCEDGRGGYYYVDRSGHNAFDKRFRHCFPFSEGTAVADGFGEGWRSINHEAQYLNSSYRACISASNDMSEGLVPVRPEGRKGYLCGFMDSTGRIAIEPAYQEAREFSEGLAPVKKDDKWGYIDTSDRVRVDFKYDDAWGFSAGIAVVKVGDKWGCIDRRGQTVIQPSFDELADCREGVMSAKKGDKWGAIDTQGNEVIPFAYDEIGEFSEGLIRAEVNGRWGFLDHAGKTSIPFKYKSACDFHEGAAVVAVPVGESSNTFPIWAYISHKGDFIVIPQPRHFSIRNDLPKDGIDHTKVLPPEDRRILESMYWAPEYERLGEFSEGLATVVDSSGSTWIINRQGRKIAEVKQADAPKPSQPTPENKDDAPTTTTSPVVHDADQ